MQILFQKELCSGFCLMSIREKRQGISAGPLTDSLQSCLSRMTRVKCFFRAAAESGSLQRMSPPKSGIFRYRSLSHIFGTGPRTGQSFSLLSSLAVFLLVHLTFDLPFLQSESPGKKEYAQGMKEDTDAPAQQRPLAPEIFRRTTDIDHKKQDIDGDIYFEMNGKPDLGLDPLPSTLIALLIVHDLSPAPFHIWKTLTPSHRQQQQPLP